jgi:chloramphenicol 3-O phosphotransferase
MRHAVHALAAQGLDLVVDDVLMGGSDPGVSEYADLLSEFSFFRVGVFASLETLEMREKQRGDRMLGLARWQFDRVHSGMEYDFEVQTDTISPAAIAEAICKKLDIQIR